MLRNTLAAALLLGAASGAIACDMLPPLTAVDFLRIARGNTLVVEHADGTVVAQYIHHDGRAERHGRRGTIMLGGRGVIHVEDALVCQRWDEDALQEPRAGPTCLRVAWSGDGYTLADAAGVVVASLSIVPGVAAE